MYLTSRWAHELIAGIVTAIDAPHAEIVYVRADELRRVFVGIRAPYLDEIKVGCETPAWHFSYALEYLLDAYKRNAT